MKRFYKCKYVIDDKKFLENTEKLFGVEPQMKLFLIKYEYVVFLEETSDGRLKNDEGWSFSMDDFDEIV